MTIYADILFLINFSMDLLTLWFTGKITHKPMKTVRLCLAAVFGALVGVAVTVAVQSVSLWTNIAVSAVGFALSVAMVYVAFGRRTTFLPLMRDSVILWGSGALLSGVMSAVLSLGEPVFVGAKEDAVFAVSFAACFLISSVAVRLFSSAVHKKTVTVSLCAGGERASFSSLVDSGNLAREPISSLPVIIVARETVPTLSRMADEKDTRLSHRMIPVRSLGGERLLAGFIPDSIKIDGREVAAAVAIDETNTSFGECGGIVPSCLVGEEIIKRRLIHK